MESETEKLEQLKDLLHRKLQILLELTDKRSPARTTATEAKELWDQICALEATQDVFADPELRRDVEEGLREISSGEVSPWQEVRKKYFTPEGRSKKQDV